MPARPVNVHKLPPTGGPQPHGRSSIDLMEALPAGSSPSADPNPERGRARRGRLLASGPGPLLAAAAWWALLLLMAVAGWYLAQPRG